MMTERERRRGWRAAAEGPSPAAGDASSTARAAAAPTSGLMTSSRGMGRRGASMGRSTSQRWTIKTTSSPETPQPPSCSWPSSFLESFLSICLRSSDYLPSSLCKLEEPKLWLPALHLVSHSIRMYMVVFLSLTQATFSKGYMGENVSLNLN